MTDYEQDIPWVEQPIAGPLIEPTQLGWFSRLFEKVLIHRNQLLLVFGICGLILASQVSLLWRPEVGVYINAASFITLLSVAVLSERARQLAISAAIIPVAVMITLCVPQPSLFSQLMVFYDALLLLTLVYRFIFTLEQPLHTTAVGLKGYIAAVPAILILGQVLGALGFGALQHHYIFDGIPLWLVALCSVVFAFTEEMFFRGLIQQRAAQIMPSAMAAILAIMLYVATSLDHTTFFVPIVALITGGVLSFSYYKRQNLVITASINVLSKLIYLGLLTIFTLH